MTERSPMMPAPFNSNQNKHIQNAQNVLPNPRTVRASDMTWFNTSGANIIKTDYNKCTGDIKKHQFPWGKTTDMQNAPFNLQAWGGQTQGQGQCHIGSQFCRVC